MIIFNHFITTDRVTEDHTFYGTTTSSVLQLYDRSVHFTFIGLNWVLERMDFIIYNFDILGIPVPVKFSQKKDMIFQEHDVPELSFLVDPSQRLVPPVPSWFIVKSHMSFSWLPQWSNWDISYKKAHRFNPQMLNSYYPAFIEGECFKYGKEWWWYQITTVFLEFII